MDSRVLEDALAEECLAAYAAGTEDAFYGDSGRYRELFLDLVLNAGPAAAWNEHPGDQLYQEELGVEEAKRLILFAERQARWLGEDGLTDWAQAWRAQTAAALAWRIQSDALDAELEKKGALG